MSTMLSYLILGLVLVRFSSQYMEMTIEDDDLCSPIKKRKIELGTRTSSGLVVKQTRLNDHPLAWTSNFHCKFKISAFYAGEGEGLIAVIQHLTFRRNTTTGECIDYVQFTKKNGTTSRQYCGRFNAALHMDHNFVHSIEKIATGNSIYDEGGTLDAVIFVSKEPLRSDEEMDLSIVFTSYKPCAKVLKSNVELKPCSLVLKEFCIFVGFFADNYINCPLPDCQDEEGCSKLEIEGAKRTIGNKVLVGSLTSLLLALGLFVLILWISRYFKIFCWAADFTNRPPRPVEPVAPVPLVSRGIEMSERPVAGAPLPGAGSSDPDKDLPPSYDSLFPVTR